MTSAGSLGLMLSHSAMFFCFPGDVGHLLQRQVSRADRGRPVHWGRHPQWVSLKRLWGDVKRRKCRKEKKVSDYSVCPAVRCLLRRSTSYTTRWASTASSRPPYMWQWAPCRCARCGSTNVRSIWWHKELRLWPLTPEDRTPAAWRRPLFIRGPINRVAVNLSVRGLCLVQGSDLNYLFFEVLNLGCVCCYYVKCFTIP